MKKGSKKISKFYWKRKRKSNQYYLELKKTLPHYTWNYYLKYKKSYVFWKILGKSGLSDYNWNRTHNLLVHKRTLNYLAKLASFLKMFKNSKNIYRFKYILLTFFWISGLICSRLLHFPPLKVRNYDNKKFLLIMLLIFVVVVSLKDKKDSTCSNDFQNFFWRNPSASQTKYV